MNTEFETRICEIENKQQNIIDRLSELHNNVITNQDTINACFLKLEEIQEQLKSVDGGSFS